MRACIRIKTKPKRTIAEIYKGRDGWRFRIKSRNGQVIATGESYTRRSDAIRGALRAHPQAVVKPGVMSLGPVRPRVW